MWLKLLFSQTGLVGIAIAAAIGLFGIKELQLKSAETGEANAKASLATAASRLTASEHARASEHTDAVSAASDAEKACGERVAAALKSGSAIRKIVGAPVALDPTTHCPLHPLVLGGQLRDAIAPAR